MGRERERELTFFAMNNLEGIGERGGNEVKEIYKKIKLEEKEWKQMKGSKKRNCRIYEDERLEEWKYMKCSKKWNRRIYEDIKEKI